MLIIENYVQEIIQIVRAPHLYFCRTAHENKTACVKLCDSRAARQNLANVLI